MKGAGMQLKKFWKNAHTEFADPLMFLSTDPSIIPIKDGPMKAPQKKNPQMHIPKYIKF